MVHKFSTLLAATVLGLSLTAGVASAGAVDDAIKARKACMKANGAAMGAFVPMMQGAKPFDAAAVAAAVASIDAACAGWDSTFSSAMWRDRWLSPSRCWGQRASMTMTTSRP